MNALTARKQIQAILDVAQDGNIGPVTMGKLNRLIVANAESVWPPEIPPANPQPVAAGNPVDARSEGNISTLHPRLQPIARQLVREAAEKGIKIVITSGTRTYAEQDALYEQGRTKPGKIVTNARGGMSNHNHGIAFDVTVFAGASPKWEGPEYAQVGQMGKQLGLSWGGDWTGIVDEPHFELRPEWAKDLSESAMLSELRKRHDENKDQFLV